ncbi:acetyl-CoA-benzylalcohol acetyltransferase-like [Lycium barbarum]|uniref:acetyl-CoA-benzylalcohol acetyltransferase-like n=1 Tax=Lycium barbarum TaxID=112863 RepID=UPI00293E95FD|nr:acetyl-CoA-benzylalcohol acetyltransferase-like [Lycium barbarum]
MAFEKENMKVKILSTKFIKPSSPTPNHLQNYKLSFFDQIADEAHLPLVLFYPPTNDTNTYNEEQLEQSLSRILTHVYPIAGRFTEDDSIYCQDQGVKFVKAKVNSKLNEFLEKAHKDVNLAMLCWPEDTWNVDDTNILIMPIVIVQITEFECGGLALSMSHTHTAMDGFTTFTFVHEWSKVCRLEIPKEKIDFLRFNLADVFPPRDLSKLLLPRLPQDNRKDTKLVAKRLYIDEDSISSLRKEVGDLCFKPSRVEMIIALLWRALIRASEKKHGHLRRSLIGVPINLRPKLISLPQVEKSFGNLVIDAPVKFIPGENKMELHNFVTLIRDTVKETIIACDKTSTEDVVSAVANIYNASFVAQEWGGNEEVDMYTSSSLCRFPIQEADFGWGKPCLMHFGSRHNQYCWLYDAECGNGICVQADLKETNMHLFERDSDIKAFFEF